MANIVYPGKAVHVATESSPSDNDEPLRDDDESSIEALIKKSMQITEGLKLVQQENSDLKVRIQEQEKKYDASQIRVDNNQASFGAKRDDESEITKLKELLNEKQKEVDKFRERLAVMSERKVIQDQRATENTLSSNRQSVLEHDYTESFRDGKRIDATEIILKKLQRGYNTGARPSKEHLMASRLACMIFEVSYESACNLRKNFTDISSIILDNMVTKAPSIAFLALKKPGTSELFQPRASTSSTQSAVQDALNEVMVLVKETAANHKLDKLVQTVKKDLETKWKQQWHQHQHQQQQQRGHGGYTTGVENMLPPFDGSLRDNLTKYIEYCCQFSWRMVTQVPPLKIGFQSKTYDPKIHNESSLFAREKKMSPSQIKCFLWPTLLDCDNRVIEKGEVVLYL